MIYCDTSLLVSALTEEGTSIVAIQSIGRNTRDQRPDADEIARAITMKGRRQQVDGRTATLVSEGQLALKSGLLMLTVTDQAFANAASLVETPPRGLRSGDALHLAVALERGCELATFDRDLARAARTPGVTAHPAAP